MTRYRDDGPIDPVTVELTDGSTMHFSPHRRGGVWMARDADGVRRWMIVQPEALNALLEMVATQIDLNAARARRTKR